MLGSGALFCVVLIVIDPILPSLVDPRSQVFLGLVGFFQWCAIPLGIYSSFVASLFGVSVAMFGPANRLVKLITYDYIPLQLETIVDIVDPETGMITGKRGILRVEDGNAQDGETRVTLFMYRFDLRVDPVSIIRLGSNRLTNWIMDHFKDERIMYDLSNKVGDFKDLGESTKRMVEIARNGLLKHDTSENETTLRARILEEVIPWTGGALCGKCGNIVNVSRGTRKFTCPWCNEKNLGPTG